MREYEILILPTKQIGRYKKGLFQIYSYPRWYRQIILLQSAMHLTCIEAKKDAVFFVYRVAMPLHRFK